MILYSGAAVWRDGDYYGPAVYRAVRMLSLGHGGQILLSGTTRDQVINALPEQVELADLGIRHLPDILQPEHIFQLIVPDLPIRFPPLRSREMLDRIGKSGTMS